MKKNDQYILQDLANAYYKKDRLKNNILKLPTLKMGVAP